MRKKEQEALIDALIYCSLRDIPPVDDGEGYWLEALAHVAKRDGSKTYAYVSRNPHTLEPTIKKVFGAAGGIAHVEAYYPYEYLRSEFIPELKNKDSKIAYLSNGDANVAKELSKLNVKDLDKEILRRAISAQIEYDNKTIYHE